MSQQIRFEKSIIVDGETVKTASLTLRRFFGGDSPDDDHGHLVVEFDPSAWSVAKLGHLSVSQSFLVGLREALADSLFDGSDVTHYGPATLSDDDPTITMLVGPNFIFSWDIHTQSLKTSTAEENRKKLIVMSKLGFPRTAIRAQLDEYIRSCFLTSDWRDLPRLLTSIQTGKEVWDDCE